MDSRLKESEKKLSAANGHKLRLNDEIDSLNNQIHLIRQNKELLIS